MYKSLQPCNMFPSQLPLYVENCSRGNSVMPSNWSAFLSLINHVDYSLNGIFIKLRHIMFRTMLAPRFIYHVPRVIKWSSKEKVCRIATRRVVAVVAHKLTVWYFSICKYPCVSMCKMLISKMNKYSIALALKMRRPCPAFAWIVPVYLFPESGMKRLDRKVPTFRTTSSIKPVSSHG